ncbi:hypothetical protein FIBSPDRAFT_931258 [Athelia psychrophila]|uniref:Uncharacterized protein n=1 Tax=Athelia psychrophila TaxID=1759441 RepID=A0A166KUM1_9AGAM|nr:hypothetical protein FIBSPDRAFT_931258 [Fibularhizoctonia sp. CBS 109695]
MKLATRTRKLLEPPRVWALWAVEGCSKLSPGESPRVRFAHVNAVACFTARVFYDTVLNALADFQRSWEEGSENWNRADGNGGGNGMRWNDSVDEFVHGLRAVHADAVDMGRDKGKGMNGGVDVQMVLVVERAKRLKETLPDLLVPLTRLAELSQVPITVILLSEFMLPFRRISSSASADDSPYNPALLLLYTYCASALHSICAPFTNDPHELAYISAARWPGFVQPVIDDRRLNDQARCESGVEIEPALAPPSEDMRMRLTRLFTPTLTTTSSTDPAKMDLRIFSRGLDERREKKGGGIPQRLLGPAPFPLDRLDAILGVLLEENDVDTRPSAPQFTIPGEYTDMEIARVHIHRAPKGRNDSSSTRSEVPSGVTGNAASAMMIGLRVFPRGPY